MLMINNMGFMFAVGMSYILLIIVTTILKVLALRVSNKFNKAYLYLERNLYYNTLIRFLLEGFLELAVAALLNLKDISFIDAEHTTNTIMSFSTIALLVIFMLFVLQFLIGNHGRLEEKYYK